MEHYRPSKRTALGVGGVVLAMLFIYASIRLHGFGWIVNRKAWFLWLIILITIPIYYFSLRSKRVFAGVDWLQSGKRWVRTYELATVTLKRSGANMMLTLVDREGRTVRVPWSQLQYNRALWDLVYNGILHSVYVGHAETNLGARNHLKLPRATG